MSQQYFKEWLKSNWISSLSMVILLAGLVTGVYLVQQEQSIRSKAADEGINSVLEVTKSDGDNLDYIGSDTYNTDTLDIKIKIKTQQ